MNFTRWIDNYGYFSLLSRYPVKLIDLDNEPYRFMHVIDEKDYRPRQIRVSEIILDPDSYIVSVARMKTHNTVGATLSLKNIVFGSPIKDKGFTLYNEDIRFSTLAKKSEPGAVSFKRLIHGGGFHAVNYNMAMLAQKIYPDLAIIDGFEGMEGNGPTLGTPVRHGYLNHCAIMGMGVADLARVEIVGENLKDHIRKYEMPPNFERQGAWMNPKA